MRKAVMSFMLLGCLCYVSVSTAAAVEKNGPKIINIKMGPNIIAFNHEKHQQVTKNQCWECHDKTNGKIENWSESTAHKLCIPCHDLNEKGPVKCKECHPKKSK